MKYYFFFLFFWVVAVKPTFAQTWWTGSADNNWHNPANWSTGVVPDSTTTVIIEPNATVPQPNWPHLYQNAKADIVRCQNNAEMYFNGYSLTCFSFYLMDAEAFTNNNAASVVFYNAELSNRAKNITVIRGKLNGSFRILTYGYVSVKFLASETNDLFLENGDGEVVGVFFRDSTLVRGNLVFNFPISGVVLPRSSSIYLYSAIIDGDLRIYFRSLGLELTLGPSLSISPPLNGGVEISGKLDIDVISHFNLSVLGFHNVSNHSPGGKVLIGCVKGLRMARCNILVDSFNIESTSNSIVIDSSTIQGVVHARSYTSQSIPLPNCETRLSGSVFFGNVYIEDTVDGIHETRGFFKRSTSPSVYFGAPNTYYGNAHFKGKVHLGMLDTSSFHGNLTIEAMDSSVFYRARFAGDSPATLNTNNNTLPFKWLGINKTAAGSLTLQSPVYISDTLALHNGKVYTPDSYVRLQQGAITEHAGAQSYVAGQVQKEGNTPFVFPVGSDVAYKPFFISSPANTDDIISVQYYAASVTTVSDTAQRASGVEAISNCEYWEVEQPQGNSTITASLMWDDPCMDTAVYIANTPQAQIAQWDGSIWSNAGNDGYANGYITTSGAVIPNGLFTFAAPKKVVIIPDPPVTIPLMVVYPNPAQQHINVYATPGFKQGIIIDAIGRRISVHQIQPGLNTLDVSRLPAGVYFLKLITQTKQQVFKWVKL